MNVFRYEFKSGMRGMIWWTVGILATSAMFFALYPSFTHDVESSKKLLEGFPPALRSALDISFNNFFTFFGFYGYSFTYVSVAGATFGAILGLGTFSKETRSKTTDFLLSKPMSRSGIFGAKLSACVAAIIISTIVFVGLDYVLALGMAGDTIDAGKFVLAASTLGLIEIWFLALGILLTQLMPRLRSIVPAALACSFSFLIISFIAAMASDDMLKYFSPYKYFDITYITTHNSFDSNYLSVWTVAIIIMIGISVSLFTRRDAKAAD